MDQYAFVMPAAGGSRRQFIILDAFDPLTGGTCGIQISHDRMQSVAKRGLAQASECAYIVPEVLKNPRSVFEGIRRDEDEDKFKGTAGWRCYCGVPRHSYRPDGTAAPPYVEEVYLVFINNESIAYNWRWEKCDPDDPGVPADYRQRFRERLK